LNDEKKGFLKKKRDVPRWPIWKVLDRMVLEIPSGARAPLKKRNDYTLTRVTGGGKKETFIKRRGVGGGVG